MIARNRMAALGLLAAGLLVCFLGFSNLSERRAAAVGAAEALAAQEAALVRNVQSLRAELAQAKGREHETVRLWQAAGGVAPVGAAQQAITNVISGEGGMILAMSDIRETTIGNLGALTMNVEAEADLAQWQGVMRGLAEYEPVMLVSSVEIRRINRVMPGAEQPLVLFRLTVDVPFAEEAG